MSSPTNFGDFGLKGVTIRGMPVLTAYPGSVFWVNSNSTTVGPKGSFDKPCAKVMDAVALCKAGRGDIIMVKAGHTETISSATAFAIAISSIAVIGLGRGSNRPTFTFGTANTATMAISADNVAFFNCVFKANFLSIAAPFTLSTAKEFAVESCSFQDSSGVLNFLNLVKSTGAANTVDGLTFNDNQFAGLGTTSVNAAVLSANDIDRLQFTGNRLYSPTTTDVAWITLTAGALTNADIGGNKSYRKAATSVNGVWVKCAAGSTGWVYDNKSRTLGSGDLVMVAGSGLAPFNNLVTDVADTSGFLQPAADV